MTQTLTPSPSDTGEIVTRTPVPVVDEAAAEPEQPRRIELSFTQLIAGAFAAMTAAVIGARLGVAGTVIGAALGSVVAGIAGSLYTASLHRGRQGLRTLAQAPRVVKSGEATAVFTPVSAPATAVMPVRQTSQVQAPQGTAPSSAPRSAEVTGRRRPWKAILAAVAATFVLTIGGLTAFELLTGNAVSGGSGTTITQVGNGGSGTQNDVDPAPAVPTETPTMDVTEPAPTETPSTDPAPTETPSTEPAPTDPAPTEPTEDPTESIPPSDQSATQPR